MVRPMRNKKGRAMPLAIPSSELPRSEGRVLELPNPSCECPMLKPPPTRRGRARGGGDAEHVPAGESRQTPRGHEKSADTLDVP